MARGETAERFKDVLKDFKQGSDLINFIFYKYHWYCSVWNRLVGARIGTDRLVRRLGIIQVRNNGGVNAEGKKLVGSWTISEIIITLGDQLSRWNREKGVIEVDSPVSSLAAVGTVILPRRMGILLWFPPHDWMKWDRKKGVWKEENIHFEKDHSLIKKTWSEKAKATTAISSFYSPWLWLLIRNPLFYLLYHFIFITVYKYYFPFPFLKYSILQSNSVRSKRTLGIMISLHRWGNWSSERRLYDSCGVTKVVKPRSLNGHFIAFSTVTSQLHIDYCVPLKQTSEIEDLIKEKYHYHRGKKKLHK